MCPHGLPGRSLEVRGDVHPRGMAVQDRTRLNGRLQLYLSATDRGTFDEFVVFSTLCLTLGQIPKRLIQNNLELVCRNAAKTVT